MPKECNHESTIDVGLVPDFPSPLSVDDVSGDSIRPVAHALILVRELRSGLSGACCSQDSKGSFSSPVQLREIARENNRGRFAWSDPGKDALTFFDFNCADKKNNTLGELRE